MARCRGWREIWNIRRNCAFEAGHEPRYLHSFVMNGPEKPLMPPASEGEHAQNDWWWWQVTWFIDESQIKQNPYDPNSGAHRAAAERDLIDIFHGEAITEDVTR